MYLYCYMIYSIIKKHIFHSQNTLNITSILSCSISLGCYSLLCQRQLQMSHNSCRSQEHIWRCFSTYRHPSATVSEVCFSSPKHQRPCLRSEVIHFRRRRTRTKKKKKKSTKSEEERKAGEGKQTQTPASFFSSLLPPCAAQLQGSRGMPETSPSRYRASCTPITIALPLILRGNINTLMAASIFTSCVY